MTYLLAIFLGAIQGLTEFLPISSTGHLIIFEKIFGISQDNFGLAFDASIHLGTLLAVVIFFYKDYIRLITFKNRMFLKLAVGTAPAVLAGLLFEKAIETTARELTIVGVALILFSIVMVFAEKSTKKNRKRENLRLTDALIIGFAQALALIPGISRSGSTISAGLFLNLTRQEAASFAFILSGPIIAAAGGKKFLEVIENSSLASGDLPFFIIGIASSTIFGYFTIKFFIKYLATSTLYPFVIYRVLLGFGLIIFSLIVSG